MRRAALLLSIAALGGPAIVAQATPVAARTASKTTFSTPAYDVSYPQCGGRLPSGGTTGIVGVTDGLPWSSSPCIASEYQWASAKSQPPQLYMNTANPETASANWAVRAGSGPLTCSTADLTDPSNTACAYNYGWKSAEDALSRAQAAIGGAAPTHAWWLDVETGNSWNGTTAANSQDLQGSIDYLRGAGIPAVGFYSTSYQWGVITGGWQAPTGAGAPSDWVAGASSATQAKSWCASSFAFSGGAVHLVQYPSGGFDGDYIC